VARVAEVRGGTDSSGEAVGEQQQAQQQQSAQQHLGGPEPEQGGIPPGRLV